MIPSNHMSSHFVELLNFIEVVNEVSNSIIKKELQLDKIEKLKLKVITYLKKLRSC